MALQYQRARKRSARSAGVAAEINFDVQKMHGSVEAVKQVQPKPNRRNRHGS